MKDFKDLNNVKNKLDKLTDVYIKQLVAGTLDMLALALSDHGHTWTPDQRKSYEESIYHLTGQKPAEELEDGE